MLAPVSRIIPFSCVDGPGNRTAVFLQGCNLRCLYCHNPETQQLCRHCGACLEHCPSGALSRDARGEVVFEPALCQSCDTCIKVCPHCASPRVRWLSAAQVWDRVAHQIPYISGLTISGGECTLWPEFLTELGALAHSGGLNVLLDSNGTVNFSLHKQILEMVDGVMLDIKALDDATHRRLTGAGNEVILENARQLSRIGKLAEVRTVIVPALCEPEELVAGLGQLLRPLCAESRFRVRLIPFRRQGVRPPYDGLAEPSRELMDELRLRLARVLGQEVY